MQEYRIEELIPQRPPFVMVDRLVSCGAMDAQTEFTVREDNIFVDNGELSAAGVMENMAQSCAARIGYITRTQVDEQAPKDTHAIGVIGDISRFEIFRQPRCHELLSTKIEVVGQVMSLTLAEVTTCIGDECVASARMKIALAGQDED